MGEGETQLIVEIPTSLHRRLKAGAALKGITLKELVIKKLEEIE